MLIAVSSTELDPAVCERARLARDARFDGLFFTAVKTTGIYCRPVCPAPTPKARNVEYFSSAAAAAAAGYRPCLRCRPERAPGAPVHRVGSELVAGALRLIEQGLLDAAPVATLAARVGVGERHLRRLFADHVGAGPLDVAATRRLLFAKQLLSETALPVAQVAGAAGYASLRRFNAAFVDAYGKPPREFRRSETVTTQGELVLRLPYRAPYDFAGLMAFFARRAIPGVEQVTPSRYRRSIVLDGTPGWFEVTQRLGEDALSLRVSLPRTTLLGPLIARVRRQFDLDAEPTVIASTLGQDALLRDALARWPGQRVPGAWDGFELAVRAVLGQQVSVAAARTLAARVAKTHGTPLDDAQRIEGVDTLFPTPAALVDAPLEQLGITRTRAATIRSLAAACLDGRLGFEPEQTLAAFVERVRTLPGIGAWTAHYIAMRALSQPDAFPAGDLVLRRAAGNGSTLTERALETLSQRWRPWRAYAVLLLWRCATPSLPEKTS